MAGKALSLNGATRRRRKATEDLYDAPPSRPAAAAERQNDSKTAAGAKDKPANGFKMTIYFADRNTVADLDAEWAEIKRLTGSSVRRSLVYEEAVRLVLEKHKDELRERFTKA